MDQKHSWPLQDYMVVVRCFTYNQVKYIEDALKGIVMQKTTFPFCALVVDDCSTDGTVDIIKRYEKEYPDIIKAVYLQENYYSQKKSKIPFVKPWHDRAKYLACCEGDDYWINSNFLQVAVGFLENHSDYSCVFGNRIVSDEQGHLLTKTTFGRDLTINDIMSGINMGLRNLCYRREVSNVVFNSSSNGDLQLYYKCAISGKMKYINDDFAVYRYTGAGVCSSLKGKEALYISYYHYYRFHQETGFQYQQFLVRFQMRQILQNLFSLKKVYYCTIYTQKFHAPSLKRFWWYIIECLFLLCHRLLTFMENRNEHLHGTIL